MTSRPLTAPPDEQPSTTLPLVSCPPKFKFDFKTAVNDTKAYNYKEPRTITPLASRPPKLELQKALAPSSLKKGLETGIHASNADFLGTKIYKVTADFAWL